MRLPSMSGGQGYPDFQPFLNIIGPDIPSVPFDDLFSDGQTQPRTGDSGFFGAVEWIEDPEKFLFRQFLKAVGHSDFQPVRYRVQANGDLPFFRCIFDRIVQN